MRRRLVSVLLVLVFSQTEVTAQRASQLTPGTLVRLALRSDGRKITGPLAEIRADSAHLSSTVTTPGASIALADVVRFEYADIAVAGSQAGCGALIGGVIGLGLGYLATRGPGNGDDDSIVINGRFIFKACGVIGTIAGNAHRPLRWKTLPGPQGTRLIVQPSRRTTAPGLSLSFKNRR